MNILIKEIEKKDYQKVIQFAITGMHFNLYLESRFLLNLYGKYFWYDELNHATQVFAAYIEDALAGVLLVAMKDGRTKYRSFGKTLYTKAFDFIQHLFYKNGADVYDKANREMFLEYRKNHTPDGQILFLAADPALKRSGIGSRLLEALERKEPDKEIYLYTDDACSYPFYEHRGFRRCCEKAVVLDFGRKKVPLKCFLYSKRTG